MIDRQVKNFQLFVDSVNSSTFPIVYSQGSSSSDLLAVLRTNFKSIARIGICFESGSSLKGFLDYKPFFLRREQEPYSDNVSLIMGIIKEFGVKNIDYLACDTLGNQAWTNYYGIISGTGVIVGASNDKTGNIKYGGDWVMESTSQDVELVYWTTGIEYWTYLLGGGGSIYWSELLPNIYTDYNICIHGAYVYVSYWVGRDIIKVNLSNGTVVSPKPWASLGFSPVCMAVKDNYMYVCNWNAKTIAQLNLSDGTINKADWAILQNDGVPYGLCIQGDWMYVSDYENGNIVQIEISNLTITTITTGLGQGLRGLTIYKNNIYVVNDWFPSKLYIINLANPSTWTSFTTQSLPTSVAVYNDIIYVAYGFAVGNISTYDLSGKPLNDNFYTPPSGRCFGLALNNNVLYCSITNYSAIQKIVLPLAPSSSPIKQIITSNIKKKVQTSQTKLIQLRAYSIYPTKMKFYIRTQPKYGKVLVKKNKAYYTPDKDFVGIDRFKYYCRGSNHIKSNTSRVKLFVG